MINLICIVMIQLGSKIDTVFMEGSLIEQTTTQYAVDFSKIAAKRGYQGDYSKFYVEKKFCGPAKKEFTI